MRVVLVGLALLLCARDARADGVDDLIEDLRTNADHKRRLAALSSLTKDGDQRAITALIEALRTDTEKTVRGAAAVALGKLVTATTPAGLKKKAMDALKAASSKKNEKQSIVRKLAKKAYKQLEALVSPGDIYVELGPMVSRLQSTNPSDADLAASMQKTLEIVARRAAKDWLTDLPADATQVETYRVDGAVDDVLTEQTSRGARVSCKVTMRIATYPDHSLLASHRGGALVSSLDSINDIEAATYDCVDAVMKDLLLQKIIPAIESGQLQSPASTSGSGNKPSVALASASATHAATWSPDGWTLLGEDDVDLIEDEVEVDRSKSTWSEVAIVVTGDAVKVNTVELALAGKGHKLQQAEIAQTFTADSAPRVIEVTGKRRTIEKVRLTYKKHTLDGETRVQVWAR